MFCLISKTGWMRFIYVSQDGTAHPPKTIKQARASRSSDCVMYCQRGNDVEGPDL